MDKKTSEKILLIASVVLLVAIVATGLMAAFIKGPANADFKDAATAIAFIGGVAVAIERIIEAFWTFLGSRLGTYWPLHTVSQQVKVLTDELDIVLKPFHESLTEDLKKLKDAQTITQGQFDEAKAEIERLKAQFDELRKNAPDSQRVQLLSAAAAQNASYLNAKYGHLVSQLEASERVANIAINGVQDFTASFKDNPGRRLISIYIGAVLGVLVSGFLGLNLFAAATAPTTIPATPSVPLPQHWAIAQIIMTGLIMGLGSNPTHEVIRAIQEYKKSQKGDNNAKPNLPTKP